MMSERDKARRDERYEDYKLAYAAFIAVYPFSLDNIEGELWADIPCDPEFYKISTYGRVKSLKRGKEKILKPMLTKDGYLRIDLSKKCKVKSFLIHRLVAEAFISNPLKLPEVDHRHGIKLDNYFENLRWVTPSENIQSAYNIGIRKSGEENSQAKLTNEQVLKIRRDYIKGDPKHGEYALSKKLGVDHSIIRSIINGRTYKNVKDDKQNEGDDKNNECI